MPGEPTEDPNPTFGMTGSGLAPLAEAAMPDFDVGAGWGGGELQANHRFREIVPAGKPGENQEPRRIDLEILPVDEALLEAAVAGAPPLFRWYQWDQATLSLGYFQDSRELELSPQWSRLPIVRRGD